MAASAGKVKLKIYLDDEQTAAEILVSSATKCTSIVQRLQRQLHANDCFLVEVWQGCERLVPEDESILLTLMDWGSDLDDVRFYLRYREPNKLITRRRSHDSQDHMLNGDRQQLERDMFPGGNKSTVDELQELAIKQQQEIAAKERELKIKEQRLSILKKSRKKPSLAYLRKLETEVEERNNRLKKLWQVQDEVQSYKLSNGVLADELVKIRDLFSAREKELALAVAKVNNLTQQLEEQRRGWAPISAPSAPKTQQEIELDRLRKELMMRNELNHQQSVQLQAQKQLMAEKHKQLFDLDAQIETLSAEVRRKRSRSDVTKDENQPEGEEKQKQQANPTWKDASRVKPVTSRPLEPLLEEEEEEEQEEGMSDGYTSSDTEYAKQQIPSPSRVNKLKSFFEESGPHQVGDKVSEGKAKWMKREVEHRAGKSKALGEEVLSSEHRVNGNDFVRERIPVPGRQVEDGRSQGKIHWLKRDSGSRDEDGSSVRDRVVGEGINGDKAQLPERGHDAVLDTDLPMSLSLPAAPLVSNTSVGQGNSYRNEMVKNSNSVQFENLTPKSSSRVLSSNIAQTGHIDISTNFVRVETSARISAQDHAKPIPSQLPSALTQNGNREQFSSKGAFINAYTSPSVKEFSNAGSDNGSKTEPLNRWDFQHLDSRDPPKSDNKVKHVSTSETFHSDNFEQGLTMESSHARSAEPFKDDTLEHSSTRKMFNIDQYKDLSTNEPPQDDGSKQLMKQPFSRDNKQGSTRESSDTDKFEPSSAIAVSGTNPLQFPQKSHAAKLAFLSSPSNTLDVDTTLAVKRSPLLGNKRRTFKTSAVVKSANSSDELPSDGDQESASEKENISRDITTQEQPDLSTELVEDSVKGEEESKSESMSTFDEDKKLSRHVQRNIEATKSGKYVVSSLKIQLSSAGKQENSRFPLETPESQVEKNDTLRDQVYAGEGHGDDRTNTDIFSDMEHDSNASLSEDTNESKYITEPDIPAMHLGLDEDISQKHFPRRSAFRKSGGLGREERHVTLHPHVVLLDAAVEGDLQVVKNVIRKVDDPSQPNLDGISALHNAVCANHEHVVSFLVESGCDVNLPDSHGWSPLHCAAANNNIDIVQYLLEHGANMFATTALEKKTPYHCCDRGFPGYLSCSKYLFDVQQNIGLFNSGRVYALYSYTACHDDELSFECHEELVVKTRGDENEKDWWWAENGRGETGYIPRNLFGICPRVAPEV